MAVQAEIDFEAVTEGLTTKSDKIRALAREGAETADIARFLGIRYQHARNVLVQSGLHNRRGESEPVTIAEGKQAPRSGWVQIDPVGRLAIPGHLLKAAGISAGGPVHVMAGEDGIEILSREAALKRAQAIAQRFVPDGVSVVDELIAERRREAEREGE